jgi:cell division protein FtsI/penicillin-binding protein 2
MNLRRLNCLRLICLLAFATVVFRLFYWQIIKHKSLSSQAFQQHFQKTAVPSNRGQILFADDFPLATNKLFYTLHLYKPELNLSLDELSQVLTQNLSSESAKLLDSSPNWVMLSPRVDPIVKKKLEALEISGLHFQALPFRDYPEASPSAHLLGFVSQGPDQRPQGYFGLEGYYHRFLTGKGGFTYQEKDAFGRPILLGDFEQFEAQSGDDLLTHLDRAIQQIVTEELAKAIDRYGAKAGEVIIMDPQTGAILAMESQPKYHPGNFFDFSEELYSNPSVAHSFDPGSIMKVVIMAAALDQGVVEPDTKCDICSGPIKIDKYTIKTWDGQYHPEINMADTIIYSDNIGMVFTARRLGKDKLYSYLKNFGFGQKTGIDLQEEISSSLKPSKQWADTDLATISFGQSIAVTSIQMLNAVSTIANQGQRLEPQIAAINSSKKLNQVISPETAQIITEIMIQSAEHGEAQFIYAPGYQIAGKTGTAQIPAGGKYDPDKTIASFIGFAPADKPRFVMLTKIIEPTSSPWGAETAAPLWFAIAKRVFVYLGIPPGEV